MNRPLIERARAFLEREEDGNAADFVSIGDLKAICRAFIAQEGWQPIETAPKDGKTILLSRAHLGDDVLYGHWNGVGWWCAWPEFHSETLAISRQLYAVAAGAHEYKTTAISNPTHWMPLPSPPKAEGVEDGGEQDIGVIADDTQPVQ